MILGVTGLYAAGKDTLAKILQEKGFFHISLSDMIREEAKKRKLKDTRENMMKLGNELRKTQGNGVLARWAIQKMEWDKNYVVTSVRNPVEVEVLRTKPSSALINVFASEKTRWNRMQKRKKAHNRNDDLTTYEEFKAKEQQESENTDPSKQQLNTVIKMSDLTISNDGTEEQLRQKTEKMLKQWKHKLDKPRPSWDEYFLHLALEVGKRATCDRGKSGCIIVKDKRIISTGYVGSPVGLPHCDEAGHLIHTVQNIDGTTTQHCIRTSHAEANAIAQAARHGVSVKEGTLYCKMEPCLKCAQLIINSGIKRVVCQKQYHGATITRDIFKQAGVKMDVVVKELEKYSKM
ncbi:AAA family ATPase [Candidatus Woesearchaeota archaeon]|nr:AAA family ATPase [Candidatus Woesearchaeota archaeon]